ncbi:MAG: hypothetical protein R3Y21_03655 [Mycoplasmatota bacterium]
MKHFLKQTKKYDLNYTKKNYYCFFIFVFILNIIVYFYLLNSYILSFIISIITTLFYINFIFLNQKKIKYETFINNQITIYISQTSMLINFNNVYLSLKKILPFLSGSFAVDLNKVIKNLETKTLEESFVFFNEKYDNKLLTQFNKSLVLLDNNGDSKANEMLFSISKQYNSINILKDKFLIFKKEIKINYYIVLLLSLSIPFMLKITIPSIYNSFNNDVGKYILFLIFLIDLMITKKIENYYSNQKVGGV